jgi:hypothetical protein
VSSAAESEFGELRNEIGGHLSALDLSVWTWKPGEHPRESRLAGTGGVALSLDLWLDKDRWRITIQGQYPAAAISEELPAEITVAAARGSRAIAEEIARRLLPRFRAQLADAKSAFDREHLATERRHALMIRFAALAGRPATHRGASSEVSLYDLPGSIYGTVSASHDAGTVTIAAHNVPAEAGLRMVDVLAAPPPDGSGHAPGTAADIVILRAAAALVLQCKKDPFARVVEYLEELAVSLASQARGSQERIHAAGDWQWPMVHRSIAQVTGVAHPVALAEIEQLMRSVTPALDQLPLPEFHALASRAYATWISRPAPGRLTGEAG